MTRPGILLTYHRLEYGQAWALQRALVADRLADRRPDTLVLLEHDPVFTIGRSGREAHWGGDDRLRERSGCPVYRVERGGSVTYHGPGQLVGYPILRLERFCAGPKAYMRRLEEVLVETLAAWGITGRWIEKIPGVWVGEAPPQKIASMGVRIDQGVTLHGFALNVSVDLRPFGWIVPCGLEGCRVTSMTTLLGQPVPLDEVRQRLARVFAQRFELEWTRDPGGDEPGAAGLEDANLAHGLAAPATRRPGPRTRELS